MSDNLDDLINSALDELEDSGVAPTTNQTSSSSTSSVSTDSKAPSTSDDADDGPDPLASLMGSIMPQLLGTDASQGAREAMSYRASLDALRKQLRNADAMYKNNDDQNTGSTPSTTTTTTTTTPASSSTSSSATSTSPADVVDAETAAMNAITQGVEGVREAQTISAAGLGSPGSADPFGSTIGSGLGSGNNQDEMKGMEEIMKLMQQMMSESGVTQEGENGDGSGGDANPEQMNKFIEDMLSQMMTPEFLLGPVRDMCDRFPKWLDDVKNDINKVGSIYKDKYTQEDIKKMEDHCQQFMKVKLALEEETPDQDKIRDLMSELESYGPPPKEVLHSMAPGLADVLSQGMTAPPGTVLAGNNNNNNNNNNNQLNNNNNNNVGGQVDPMANMPMPTPKEMEQMMQGCPQQ